MACSSSSPMSGPNPSTIHQPRMTTQPGWEVLSTPLAPSWIPTDPIWNEAFPPSMFHRYFKPAMSMLCRSDVAERFLGNSSRLRRWLSRRLEYKRRLAASGQGVRLSTSTADGTSLPTYGTQRPNLVGTPKRNHGHGWINNFFTNPRVFVLPPPLRHRHDPTDHRQRPHPLLVRCRYVSC